MDLSPLEFTDFFGSVLLLGATFGFVLFTCGKKKPPPAKGKGKGAEPAAAPAAAGGAVDAPAAPDDAAADAAPPEGADAAPDDGPQTIGVFPRQLAWEYDNGQSTFLIKNSTEKTFGTKIKVTNPNLYSVAPTHCIIGPHKSLTIVVLRKAGPFKDDKIIVVYAQAEVSDIDAKEFFKKEGLKTEQIEITQKPKKEGAAPST